VLFSEIKEVQKLNRRVARQCDKAKVRSRILTTLMGEIESKTTGTGLKITDDLVIETIIKFVKNIALTLEKATAPMAHLHLERETLECFLPDKLSETELESQIKLIIATNDIVDIGIVMKELNAQFKGQFDGKLAKDIIQREL